MGHAERMSQFDSGAVGLRVGQRPAVVTLLLCALRGEARDR